MTFKHQNYRSKYVRPIPEVFHDPDAGLLIVATPWGERSSAEKCIETLHEYYISTSNELSDTSPFEIIPNLSAEGNILRTGLRLANDRIYSEDNANEFTSGTEVFALLTLENEIVWTQIGQPNLFIKKQNSGLQPASLQRDLSIEFNQESFESILPSKLLGVYPRSDFSIESSMYAPSDEIILMSRPLFPSGFQHGSLDQMISKLVESDPSLPFWIGHLS